MFKRRWLTVGLTLCGLALLAAACVVTTPTAVPPTATGETTEGEGEGESEGETSALPAGDAAQGQYVFALAWGCGCHNGQAGQLAGGNRFGPVLSANITPDPDTGLGNWTDRQIADAIRLGKRPDGRQLSPAMPYHFFSGMADQDVADLIAYLRSVPAVNNPIPEPELDAPFPAFEPQMPPRATSPTEPVARGEYIVSALARCSGCHTGLTPEGTPDMAKYLAGHYDPVSAIIYPNITPDEDTGIGLWTEEQIATLLQTGMRPDGNQVFAPMADVVERGLHEISTEDALAVAAYLKSIPAVENAP